MTVVTPIVFSAHRFRDRRSQLWGVELDGELISVRATKNDALEALLYFVNELGAERSTTRLVRVSRKAAAALEAA